MTICISLGTVCYSFCSSNSVCKMWVTIQVKVELEQCLPVESSGVTVYIVAHSLQSEFKEKTI